MRSRAYEPTESMAPYDTAIITRIVVCQVSMLKRLRITKELPSRTIAVGSA